MSNKHKNYVFNLRLDKYGKDKKTYEYLQEQNNKNRTIKKALDYMQTLFGDGDLDEAIDRFNVNVIKNTVLGINKSNPLAITKDTYSSKDSDKSDKKPEKRNNQHDSKKRKQKITDENNKPKKKIKVSKHKKDVSSDTSTKNAEEEKASENEVRAMLWNGDPTTL